MYCVSDICIGGKGMKNSINRISNRRCSVEMASSAYGGFWRYHGMNGTGSHDPVQIKGHCEVGPLYIGRTHNFIPGFRTTRSYAQSSGGGRERLKLS